MDMAVTMKRPAAFTGFTNRKVVADFPNAAAETSIGAPELEVLREIRAEQARQRATLATILRLLERGRGARDQADVALLVAVAEAIGDRPFTSAALMAHGDADPALREALTAADVTTPRELGMLCRRLEGVLLAGLCLERVDAHRHGIVWCVRVSDPHTRATGYSGS